MSTKLSAGRVRAPYQFIKAHRGKYSVQALCRILGVAPSGYYEWLTHPVSNRAQEDALIAPPAAAGRCARFDGGLTSLKARQ